MKGSGRFEPDNDPVFQKLYTFEIVDPEHEAVETIGVWARSEAEAATKLGAETRLSVFRPGQEEDRD